MAVYFIRADKKGPVKIGYTGGDIRRRLGALQTASAVRLHAIRLIEGERAVEQDIHKRFADDRIAPRGEWFRFNAEMLTIGTELPIPSIPERPTLRPLFLSPTNQRPALAAKCLIEKSKSRVKEWLASQIEQRHQIAREAGVDEKTIRLSLAPDWDPRASTLHKLETVMPKKRGRVA